MGTMRIRASVSVHGPLSEAGAARAALDAWRDRTAKRLADEGADRLRAWPMDKTGRSTGGFQSLIQVRGPAAGTAMIPGPQVTGVAWAPWLEGKSKRNRSTRFAGYGLFAKTTKIINAMAVDVGEDELSKVIDELGGGA